MAVITPPSIPILIVTIGIIPNLSISSRHFTEMPFEETPAFDTKVWDTIGYELLPINLGRTYSLTHTSTSNGDSSKRGVVHPLCRSPCKTTGLQLL